MCGALGCVGAEKWKLFHLEGRRGDKGSQETNSTPTAKTEGRERDKAAGEAKRSPNEIHQGGGEGTETEGRQKDRRDTSLGSRVAVTNLLSRPQRNSASGLLRSKNHHS